MSLALREATTSSPTSNHRLSTTASRQDDKDVSSRLGGFIERVLRPASVRHPASVHRSPSVPPFPPLERKSTFRLQDYLPQAAEERDITEKVDAIQEHLENHVNHFYQFKMMPSVSASRPVETNEPPLRPGELMRQSTKTSISPTPTELSSSIQSIAPVSAPADKRRLRAYVHQLTAARLIRGIQPKEAGERAAFLPHELSILLSALPLPESMEDNEAFTNALSQWRVLSFYLLKDKTVRKANDRSFQKRLDREIEKALQSLNEDLEPYVDKSRDEERQDHLRSLMELTSDLGILITSQAAVFRFSWDYEPEDDRDSQWEPSEPPDGRSNRECHNASATQRRSRSNRGVTVLFPALLMTTGYNGSRLTKPVCICEPQTERFRTRVSRRRTEEKDAGESLDLRPR